MIVKRAAISASLALVIVGLAMLGMLVSMAPEPVSLLIEPLSLLLLPGLVIAMLGAGPHDFNPALVIYVSLAFYFVTTYAFLARSAHHVDSARLTRSFR